MEANWRRFIHDIVKTPKVSMGSRIYGGVMLFAIIIGVFPLMFRHYNQIFWWMDLISSLLFIIDYFFRWCTADFESKYKDWRAYVVYPFTPMAIIDLLSILPVFNMISPTFKVVRVSRLLKLQRIFKVVRYFEPLMVIVAVIRKQGKILWTVASLALFYIFITALIMFNAEEEINPANGQPLFRDFFDAFYWAACKLTTVGYGDLYPISNTGRVISILSSIVGIAIIALPSGIITAGYMDELKLRKELKEREENAPLASAE